MGDKTTHLLRLVLRLLILRAVITATILTMVCDKPTRPFSFSSCYSFRRPGVPRTQSSPCPSPIRWKEMVARVVVIPKIDSCKEECMICSLYCTVFTCPFFPHVLFSCRRVYESCYASCFQYVNLAFPLLGYDVIYYKTCYCTH